MAALRQIRRGIHYYRVSVMLVMVTALFAATLSFASGTPQFPGVSAPNSLWSGTNSGAILYFFGLASVGAVIAFGLFASLTGLVGGTFWVMAWLTWRGGVRDLLPASGEFGPIHSRAARTAERDYGFTVRAFLGWTLAAIVMTVATAVTFLPLTVGMGGPTPGSSRASVDTLARLRLELFITILFAAFVLTLLQFLSHYFGSRSLQEAVTSLVSNEQRARLERGRTLILWGAALTVVAVLPLFFFGLVFFAVVPPLLLFLGFSQILGVYDDWLASPRRPGGTALTW